MVWRFGHIFSNCSRASAVRNAGRFRGLRGGEEPAAATPGLGQRRSGVHPGVKIVAPALSPEYDGLEDSKPRPRKASIWERSAHISEGTAMRPCMPGGRPLLTLFAGLVLLSAGCIEFEKQTI